MRTSYSWMEFLVGTGEKKTTGDPSQDFFERCETRVATVDIAVRGLVHNGERAICVNRGDHITDAERDRTTKCQYPNRDGDIDEPERDRPKGDPSGQRTPCSVRIGGNWWDSCGIHGYTSLRSCSSVLDRLPTTSRTNSAHCIDGSLTNSPAITSAGDPADDCDAIKRRGVVDAGFGSDSMDRASKAFSVKNSRPNQRNSRRRSSGLSRL